MAVIANLARQDGCVVMSGFIKLSHAKNLRQSQSSIPDEHLVGRGAEGGTRCEHQVHCMQEEKFGWHWLGQV